MAGGGKPTLNLLSDANVGFAHQPDLTKLSLNSTNQNLHSKQGKQGKPACMQGSDQGAGLQVTGFILQASGFGLQASWLISSEWTIQGFTVDSVNRATVVCMQEPMVQLGCHPLITFA